MRRDPGSLAFTDLLFNALLGFVVMFTLAFLLINPIARSGAIDPKAELLITLSWPDGARHDVDLYVEDPAGHLVWFRQREAGLMHLDRDDLGQQSDLIEVDGVRIANPLNQEVVSLRGILPGEYVVNVHLYRATGPLPVPATVKIERINPKVEVVFYGTVELGRQGEEQTAARFILAADGRVAGVSRLPKALVPLRRLGAPAESAP